MIRFENNYFNLFHVTVLFRYPLKTSKNLWFSDVFSGYRKRPVAWNGLIQYLLTAITNRKKRLKILNQVTQQGLYYASKKRSIEYLTRGIRLIRQFQKELSDLGAFSYYVRI